MCSHSHLLLSGLNQLGLPLSLWTGSTSKVGMASGLCPSSTQCRAWWGLKCLLSQIPGWTCPVSQGQGRRARKTPRHLIPSGMLQHALWSSLAVPSLRPGLQHPCCEPWGEIQLFSDLACWRGLSELQNVALTSQGTLPMASQGSS